MGTKCFMNGKEEEERIRTHLEDQGTVDTAEPGKGKSRTFGGIRKNANVDHVVSWTGSNGGETRPQREPMKQPRARISSVEDAWIT